MAKNKTTQTTGSVTEFINSVKDEAQRNDSFKIVELFKASRLEPKMWGPAIIGFGSYHYIYDSGREGDAPLAAFSPRKNAIRLYLALNSKREELLQKLGKHKVGKECIYIKKLEDINRTY